MRKEEIENAIEPVVTSHGCELWGIELLRGKKKDLQ
jgi:ribosome maturation factor RimP